MTPPLNEPAAWPLRDYVSPGLRVVRPDDAFPHMRAGDALHHPWKYLRRDVPHIWYADERYPVMGFLNRDEAALLHNIALQFAGKPALEIGSWLGWSTCHLALAGVMLDVIDPAHDDPAFRAIVEESLQRCGVADRVKLAGGRSPETIGQLGRQWSLFFIDGDHEAPAPVRDALACLPFATDDCAFVFHDLASPAVAAGLRALRDHGFEVVVYQTAQLMAMAWRGNAAPVLHHPDPDVAWQLPPHLAGLPISGVDYEPRRDPRRRYPALAASIPAGEISRPSVCIVTAELIGPFKNGGIGTATTGLAELLASEGLPVTVLYTGGIWSPDVSLTEWKRRYAALGITLEALTLEDTTSLAGVLRDRGFPAPWLIQRFLAARHFDVIHFNDCCGEASLTIAAKKLGLAFHDSLLVVGLHSPSSWVLELNQTLPSNVLFPAYDYAERVSISSADMLWSPSEYLLDWIGERGFEAPAQTFVQQYVMPTPRLRDASAATAAPPVRYGRTDAPAELVFFGRLEERKGLRLFCNAVHLLRDELASRGITVTFLGKPERCGGLPSLDYIRRRAAEWRFPVKTLTDFGQPEALQYLGGGGKLAVMPSPFDNSPCTIYEALGGGIPFLAARTGGIPELVDAADREHVLFEYATEPLRAALRRALDDGGWIARPAVPRDDARRTWAALHAHWRAFLPPPPPHGARAATIAAVVDHRPDAELGRTLQSLAGCPAVRRVIVLNRSGKALPFANIDLLTEDLGALDLELSTVTEDTVLLIHAGVSAVPDGIAAMLRSLEAAADVDGLLPAARIGRGVRGRVAPSLGGSAAFSFFEGATFTGALLIRREALLAAKEGRLPAADVPFLGLADYCITSDARIWPFPQVATERGKHVLLDSRSSLPARIAAYGAASASDRYYMLAGGYAANLAHRTGSRRELALALVSSGFGRAVRLGLRALRGVRRLRR
jgi:glycosyltransferase involved in cell wall biosynthesis